MDDGAAQGVHIEEPTVMTRREPTWYDVHMVVLLFHLVICTAFVCAPS